jgi:hypothetical protein
MALSDVNKSEVSEECEINIHYLYNSLINLKMFQNELSESKECSRIKGCGHVNGLQKTASHVH